MLCKICQTYIDGHCIGGISECKYFVDKIEYQPKTKQIQLDILSDFQIRDFVETKVINNEYTLTIILEQNTY